MPNQKANPVNFFETELTAQMGGTDLTAIVTDTTGLTSPCSLIIEPDDQAQREVIYFDGTYTGTSLATTSIANRYQQGSAAGSGLVHPVNSKVRVAPVGQEIIDLHDRIDAEALHDHPASDLNDTTITGTQLNTLSGGGDADALHTHAGKADAASRQDGSVPSRCCLFRSETHRCRE